MQETVATILEYVTKWLTAYFAIYGSIIAIGFIVFIVILILENREEKKRRP